MRDRDLRPTLVIEPDGTTYLLPPVDEPRLAPALRWIVTRTHAERVVLLHGCARCDAAPGQACARGDRSRRPHRTRRRAYRRAL